MSRFSDVVERLATVIAERQDADPASSWTAKLLSEPRLAAKKLGEEAIETALADYAHATAAESADLLYHWLVLIQAGGVTLEEVAAKLAALEGASGISEKAARKP